jgi:hypothetical protein
LDAPIVVTTNTAANDGNVTFDGTVDGAQTLAIDAGAEGDVSLTGVAGGVTPLTSLTVTESDNTTLHGVSTTGAQSITADAGVSLSGDYFAAGGFTVDTDDAGTTLVVTLAADVLIDTRGGGNVNLNPDAANNAEINIDGTTVAILDTSVNHMPEVFEYQFEPDAIGDCEGGKFDYLLAGSTCLAGDTFGRYGFDQRLDIGSRVVFTDVGAYTLVKASAFNGLRLPTVYALTHNNDLVIVREHAYDDYARECGGRTHAFA